MSRKRAALTVTTDDEPANPITGESNQEVWQRWSHERDERERRAKLAAEADAKARTEAGIFAVEIARHVAQSAAQGFCPEWRYLKPLIAAEYGRILREQPEMRQRDVRAREQIVVALFNGLPHHLHGALSELRTIMELVQMAHESTAFLLGFEIGREAGKAASRAGREVRALPASTEPNRLTFG